MYGPPPLMISLETPHDKEYGLTEYATVIIFLYIHQAKKDRRKDKEQLIN